MGDFLVELLEGGAEEDSPFGAGELRDGLRGVVAGLFECGQRFEEFAAEHDGALEGFAGAEAFGREA